MLNDSWSSPLRGTFSILGLLFLDGGLDKWPDRSTFISHTGSVSLGQEGCTERRLLFYLKRTDSTNHAVDWATLPGSGGGIITSVERFSQHSTPGLGIKTNHLILTNQGRGNTWSQSGLWNKRHNWRGKKVDFLVIAVAVAVWKLATLLRKRGELFLCCETERLRKLAHLPQMLKKKTGPRWCIGRATHWCSSKW